MVGEVINSRMFRFAAVGGSGIVVNIVVTELCVVLGLHLVLAAAFGAVVSVVTNFLMLEHWAFHDRGVGRLWHRFAGFAGIGAVDYAVRAPLLVLLAPLLPTAMANFVTIMAVFVLRYVLSARVVWRASTEMTGQTG